jgi:hypothetical protein
MQHKFLLSPHTHGNSGASTLLKVTLVVILRYDCTQLLWCGKGWRSPRTNEYKAPGRSKAHKSQTIHSSRVHATFAHNNHIHSNISAALGSPEVSCALVTMLHAQIFITLPHFHGPLGITCPKYIHPLHRLSDRAEHGWAQCQRASQNRKHFTTARIQRKHHY